MKNPVLPALFALSLVGGSVAGAAVVLLMVSGEARTSSATSAAPSAADGALVTRLNTLAEECRALRERVESLELRPAPEPRVPVASLDEWISKEEFDVFRAELRGSLASLAPPSGEPTALKEQVAGALAEIRKDEKVESVRVQQEKRAARLDQDVAVLHKRLELNDYQANQMRTALLGQYERETALRTRWEQGDDPQLLGEQKRADGELFREDVQRILSAEQLDRFWKEIARGGKS